MSDYRDYKQDEPDDGDDVIIAYGDAKKLKAELAALREENERLYETNAEIKHERDIAVATLSSMNEKLEKENERLKKLVEEKFSELADEDRAQLWNAANDFLDEMTKEPF